MTSCDLNDLSEDKSYVTPPGHSEVLEFKASTDRWAGAPFSS